MRTLWNRIAGIVASWRGVAQVRSHQLEPCLICSYDVVWEVQGQRGEARLREVSATRLRLHSERAVVAGRRIRLLPKVGQVINGLPAEVADGVVEYSRARHGRFEIGVRLCGPEQGSATGWLRRLRRDPDVLRAGALQRPAVGGVPRLTLCRSLKGIE